MRKRSPPLLLLLSLSLLLSLQLSAERLLRHAALLHAPIYLSLQHWNRTGSWRNVHPPSPPLTSAHGCLTWRNNQKDETSLAKTCEIECASVVIHLRDRASERAYTSKNLSRAHSTCDTTRTFPTWRPETSSRRHPRPHPTAHRQTTSSSALCESAIVSRSPADHADTASSNATEAIHATIAQSAATRRLVTMPHQRVRSKVPPAVPINLPTTCKIALID
jgi:hypothetical protein